MADKMGEIGLLMSGWDRKTGRNRLAGQGGGGVEGPEVAGSGLGAPSFDIELPRATGSGDCHHFYRCYRGEKVFVSVKQNNHNTLNTNQNCNTVQDSTSSTYNIIVIRGTKKHTNNKNFPRKKSHKLLTSKLKIPTST